MNEHVKTEHLATACPHDCPSTCALEVEVIDGQTIGRMRGAKDNTYTAGVICAKVARYAERLYHPARLTRPLMRKGDKGGGEWQDIDWEDALDLIAERFLAVEMQYGSEAIWPYYYAGTMGLVQRDSIHRLRHAKRYSGQFDTICVKNSWTGTSAATGKLMGPDPREMAKADCVVIWGTNAVSTQVNVMTHVTRARKERGAKIVCVDVYMNDTMKQADMPLVIRPGTDAALACATMHILFRDGLADWDYMRKFADEPEALEEHLKTRTPEWASRITGLAVDEIEAFAHLVGETKATYFRLGYGFSRSRNGAVAMHAAFCIPTVTGAWQFEGGGGFHTNGDIFGIDNGLVKGEAFVDPDIRTLDQAKIGRVLTGDAEALCHGPPVHALLVQNTNPVNIAPEQRSVVEGFKRDDLFVAVHEQFLTETAELADIVLPATMFVEHDDIYRGGGNQHLIYAPKLVDGPELCRSNLFVIDELASRLGVGHFDGFGMTANEHIDAMLKASERGSLDEIRETKWIDCQPDFETSHYLNGFAHQDGKFHFRADWAHVPWGAPPECLKPAQLPEDMPDLPDQWNVIEESDEQYPFRLATSPARSFLNSTFAETESSKKKEGRPELLIHKQTAQMLGIGEGSRVRVFNERGEVILHARLVEDVQSNVVIAEGLHPNKAHEGGWGINVLTGADFSAPHGGTPFHDTHVNVLPA